MELKDKIRINQLIDLKKRPLEREEVRELLEDLRKTLSFHKIHKITGISKTTLFYWLTPKQKGIQKRCPHWIKGECTKNDCNRM